MYGIQAYCKQYKRPIKHNLALDAMQCLREKDLVLDLEDHFIIEFDDRLNKPYNLSLNEYEAAVLAAYNELKNYQEKLKDIVIIEDRKLSDIMCSGYAAKLARQKNPVSTSIKRVKGFWKLTMLFFLS